MRPFVDRKIVLDHVIYQLGRLDGVQISYVPTKSHECVVILAVDEITIAVPEI
jgi:hypothetical protein